jgi:hypothetical protein
MSSSREAQGLPPKIEDEQALRDVAQVFAPYLEPEEPEEDEGDEEDDERAT